MSRTIIYDHSNDRVENRFGAEPAVQSAPQPQRVQPRAKRVQPEPIPSEWEQVCSFSDLLYFRMTSEELLALRTIFPDAKIEYDRKPFTEIIRTSVFVQTSTYVWYKYLLQAGYDNASLSFQLSMYDNPRALLTILHEVQAEEKGE